MPTNDLENKNTNKKNENTKNDIIFKNLRAYKICLSRY